MTYKFSLDVVTILAQKNLQKSYTERSFEFRSSIIYENAKVVDLPQSVK